MSKRTEVILEELAPPFGIIPRKNLNVQEAKKLYNEGSEDKFKISDIKPHKIRDIFLKRNLFVYEADTKTAYIYDNDKKIWRRREDALIKGMLEEYVVKSTPTSITDEAFKKITRLKSTDSLEWNSSITDEYTPFLNGLHHIKTNKIKSHSPNNCITTLIPHKYNPRAKCPTWHKFLDSSLPCKTKQLILQMFFGYMLCVEARYKRALLSKGKKNCGKSVIQTIAEHVVGNKKPYNNVSGLTPNDFEDSGSLFAMVGKYLNICGDLGKNIKLGGRFKTLVSSNAETIMINEKFKPQYSVKFTTKIIMSSNHMPTSFKDDGATMERLSIICFNRSFSKDEQDKNLTKKLLAEIEGIVQWALEGKRQLLETNGDWPEEQEEIELKQGEILRLNPFKKFVKTRCATGNKKLKIHRVILIDEYNSYLEENFPGMVKKYGKIGVERMDQLVREELDIKPSKVQINNMRSKGYSGLAVKKKTEWD